jgi:uncharacterized protein YbjT (DUF2867 family)
VFVHSPAKLGSFKNDVSIVKGDLLNASLLGEALIGSEAVLNLAGDIKELEQFNKFQQIADNLVEAMSKQCIQWEYFARTTKDAGTC